MINIEVAKSVIGVIRREQQERADRLRDEDPDFALDHWLSWDVPFLNDMCLMVLVALRHHVERELISLATRANIGEAMSAEDYKCKLKENRNLARSGKGWKNFDRKLSLSSFPDWTGPMETLRLLANDLKHAPGGKPEKELLTHLKLQCKPEDLMRPLMSDDARFAGYASISESDRFRKGLAETLSLSEDADYCTISEKFTELAEKFLKDVKLRNRAARIIGSVSLHRFLG